MNNKIELYHKIKKMREKILAPVDIMGCYSFPNLIEGDSQKLYVLVSLLLSSQTKDEVNFQSMLNLIKSRHGSIQQHEIRYKNIFESDKNYLDISFNGKGYKIYNKEDFKILIRNNLKDVNFNIKNLLEMTTEEINKCISKVGFHNKKSETIKELCKKISAEGFPTTLKECLDIKGLGLKMSLLYLNKFYGTHGVSVDTHVHRISNRIGLVKTLKPDQISKELEKIFDKTEYENINSVFVGFGQIICTAVNPKCVRCEIKNSCKFKNNW